MAKKVLLAVLFAFLVSLPVGVSLLGGTDFVSGLSTAESLAFYHDTSPDCNDHV